jgi:hypothetical protein
MQLVQQSSEKTPRFLVSKHQPLSGAYLQSCNDQDFDNPPDLKVPNSPHYNDINPYSAYFPQTPDMNIHRQSFPLMTP